MVGDVLYTVKEEEIIDKAAEFKQQLINMKIKIANAALKMRDALYGCDHPAHHKECANQLQSRHQHLRQSFHGRGRNILDIFRKP